MSLFKRLKNKLVNFLGRSDYVDRVAQQVPGLRERDYYVTFWVSTINNMENIVVSCRFPLYSSRFYMSIRDNIIAKLEEHIKLEPGEITIINIMPVKDV